MLNKKNSEKANRKRDNLRVDSVERQRLHAYRHTQTHIKCTHVVHRDAEKETNNGK